MIPRTRFTLLIGSGCMALGVLLTGCGADPDAGTNGVGKLAPEAIEKKTRSAVAAARAVRMSGTIVSKGETFRLDMRLKAGGGVGQVTNGGSTFELLRVGKELFLKADEEFYRNRGEGDAAGGTGGKSAARKLEGKYVKVPSEDPAYKQLSGFTDIGVLLEVFFILDGKLEKDGHGKVGGVPTVVLEADGGKGGTVEVSLDGEPYPLRYKRAGGGGTLQLSDYNKDFTLNAPADKQVVDYGKQISAAKP